ncbi:TolC family protein [Deinococcus sonorensis]|uniref:TolC family protein n=2 Tax=Deinococcus sonorensis TaxID=309891 RepID=A0AAU7UCJ7_9DEIO
MSRRTLMLALLLGAGSAQGQAASGVTLQQLIAALPQAPGWRSAELQFRSAQLALDAARARAGLGVSVGGDLNRLKAPASDGAWLTSGSVNLQASANLLPWSSAADAVRQAGRAVERAGLNRLSSQQTLTLNVVQQYLAARAARQAATLAEAQQRLAAEQLQVTQQQRAAGLTTQEALLDARSALEQRQAALQQAQGSLDLALRLLYGTLGLPLPPQPPQLSSGPVPPGAPAALDSLLAGALRQRPDVQVALSSVQDARAALDSARRDRAVPNVSASVQYGQLGSATSSATGTVYGGSLNVKTGVLSGNVTVPFQSVDQPNSLVLGLSGNFAVLDRAADTAIQSAQSSLDSAELSLQTARQSAELDVRQQLLALQNALAALPALQTGLLRAQTALASGQARLQAGLDTPLQLKSLQLNVQQARNALEQATGDAYLASLRLSVAVGEFSPALITLPDAPLSEPIPGDQP